MDDRARQTLLDLVAKERDIALDHRRCRAFLLDLCAQCRGEIRVLVWAVEEGLIAELLDHVGDVPAPALIARLANRLQEDCCVVPAAAQWAIESWALALGVVAGAGNGRQDAASTSRPKPPVELPQPLAVSPTTEKYQSERLRYIGQPKEITNSIGMKLVLIPAGEFMMGSPDSEKDRSWDEGPVHRVKITRPFYMAQYEVTQVEYQQVMGSNPSQFKKVSGQDTSRFPVENVSWEDAVEFCKKLSERERRTYRLPTEAEWEYACRAGTTTPFDFGSVLNGRQANCNGNFPYGTDEKGRHLGRATAVGSYRPNAFGLYDMHGNVWEWCADWYDAEYYANSPADDPAGPSWGSLRVLRSGSWSLYARGCRSAYRNSNTPEYRNINLGFRVLLVGAE